MDRWMTLPCQNIPEMMQSPGKILRSVVGGVIESKHPLRRRSVKNSKTASK